MEKSSAQQISDRYKNDGQCFIDTDGGEIEDACASSGQTEKNDAWTRFTFPDGSVITVAGDGWDLGFECCHGWQGAGHSSDCENRK